MLRHAARSVITVALLSGSLFGGAGPAVAAETVPVPAAGQVSGGIYSSEWSISGDLDALAAATGKRVTFGGTFHDIYENDGTNASWSNTREILDEVWRGEATPFANVAINASAYRIARGDYDAKIADWATHVRQYLDKGDGRSVIISPLQEMNYRSAAWSCDPGNYKIAYRKFVDTFRSTGLDETKVRWAFAPNNWTSPGCGRIADYYPGGGYVDVIGISAYNWGTCVGSRWESPAQVFGPALEEIRSTVDGTKPYLVAQTAVPRSSGCGGSQDRWIREAFDYLAADPNVVGLIYFNFSKETDWRVWTRPTVTSGWRDAMSSPATAYLWPLSSWFRPGRLVVSNGPGPADDVTVLGGTAAVSESVAYEIGGILGGMPARLAGTNRYDTAARIANSVFSPGVSVVFVATGAGYPDALAAGAAAAKMGGPLLLVSKDAIPAETRAELARLRPGTIYVAGGSAVVSETVVAALGGYTNGDVIRLAGADRFGTAAAVAAAAFPGGVDTVYIATGRGFPDALSGGAAAATVGGAVLLAEFDDIPDETVVALQILAPSTAILVGGTAVLSSEHEATLRSLGIEQVRRIAGPDRYATSAAVSADLFSGEVPRVFVATGTAFPDALAGVAAAGRLPVPVLLTDPERVPPVIGDELERLLGR